MHRLKVALTGTHGVLGSRLVKRLDRDAGCRRLILLDLVPPARDIRKAVFYRVDLTEPAASVHPAVEQVMREVGIELGDTRPRTLTGDLVARADVLITMGCGASCPVVPGVPREDWPLPDPKGQPLERVREIRDQIRARVETLIERSGWEP